jgi:hypothetical protein
MPLSGSFSKEPAFVNREAEMLYLKTWISARPENILFLYGPKSSGKTTLIYKFIEQYLPARDYEIKHFNLRELLLINYESFLRAFFELKRKDQVKETRQYDLKVFKLSLETIKGLESRQLDPFIVMKRELEKINRKGRRPVIIIDELQALDEIYFNGGRELINEMFNFFVAISKESHLCHVIISSSDGYFIERVYHDSKLKKTSELMEVAYLQYEHVMDWLGDLGTYSKIDRFVLSDGQRQAIWEFFGGSCWEVSNFLGQLLNIARDGRIADQDFNELLEKKRIFFRSMFMEYASIIPKKKALLREISKAIVKKGSFVLEDLTDLVEQDCWEVETLIKELGFLVSQNFLSYAPPRAEYAMQGRSMELGLAAYIKFLGDGV